MKQLAFALGFVPFLCAFGTSASLAADAPRQDCSVAALVKGAGAFDSQHFFELSQSTVDDINWWQGSLAGAVAYGCNDWNIQADGAFSSFWASKDYPPGFLFPGGPGYYQSRTGHIGADAFWREAENAKVMFGVSVSRIFTMTSVQFPTDLFNPDPVVQGGGLWRVGAMGEAYASDSITLGAGAYYLNGYPFVDFQHQHGFEGDIYAKFYANPNLSFSLRGDLQATQTDITTSKNGAIEYINGIAGALQAEYLIPDTSLSVFAGGRYSSRRLTANNTADYIDNNDTVAYLGLTYAFGSAPHETLVQRDRSGTVDNTSVMFEQLPAFRL